MSKLALSCNHKCLDANDCAQRNMFALNVEEAASVPWERCRASLQSTVDRAAPWKTAWRDLQHRMDGRPSVPGLVRCDPAKGKIFAWASNFSTYVLTLDRFGWLPKRKKTQITLSSFCLATEPDFRKIPSMSKCFSSTAVASTKNLRKQKEGQLPTTNISCFLPCACGLLLPRRISELCHFGN